MTSIAETKSSAAGFAVRDAERRTGRNFNLRAYLAGSAATTALIAGAIVVFASLGAYVAFNGLPIGSGDENASQLTIGAQARAPQAAAASLARAPGAVAATAAAGRATAPGAGQPAGGNAGGGSSAGPSTADPIAPTTGTTATTPSGVPTGGASSATGPIDAIGGTANVPLGNATDPVTGPAGAAIRGALGMSQGGQQVTTTIGGLTQGVDQALGR